MRPGMCQTVIGVTLINLVGVIEGLLIEWAPFGGIVDSARPAVAVAVGTICGFVSLGYFDHRLSLILARLGSSVLGAFVVAYLRFCGTDHFVGALVGCVLMFLFLGALKIKKLRSAHKHLTRGLPAPSHGRIQQIQTHRDSEDIHSAA